MMMMGQDIVVRAEPQGKDVVLIRVQLGATVYGQLTCSSAVARTSHAMNTIISIVVAALQAQLAEVGQ